MPELPEVRRLVVEAGFAAVHLGLNSEIRTILAALPGWIDDPVVLASCQATLLFGLNKPTEALERLEGLPDDVCPQLRELLHARLAARPANAA
ncbi:EscG/YscG/SsaH family type III secretion system needle protein co-chaperone [Chitinimonas sp. BJB300]|nr:EscG/YscG/SsaH family type III secretion system needle protein co-chaperone [Chitinimonas sp. BJB300]TSJ88652.1 DUF1039 domain-containing protein [Chitinimonas sp. BJB300]